MFYDFLFLFAFANMRNRAVAIFQWSLIQVPCDGKRRKINCMHMDILHKEYVESRMCQRLLGEHEGAIIDFVKMKF